MKFELVRIFGSKYFLNLKIFVFIDSFENGLICVYFYIIRFYQKFMFTFDKINDQR